MIGLLRHNKAARVIFILAGIAAVYLAWHNAPMIYRPLHISCISLRLALRGAIASIPMVAFLLCLHRPSEIIASLGLNGSVIRGMGFAALCCVPLLVGFPIIGTFDDHLSFDYFFRTVVLAAFLEEVVFRGFMFGQLFRYGKIGFLWAILIPAILFGIGHLYQGHSLISSLIAFGVTALGALYFSWAYVECNFNLWVPIGLHMFMNFCWIVFPVEGNETSVGALWPNILRLAAVVLTITLVMARKKKCGGKIFGYPVVRV